MDRPKRKEMKVNIIFLDYLRHEFTDQVKKQNFYNAGHPFHHVTIDMKGIANAINHGIKQSLDDYDAIVTMANDILMPENWLKSMVLAATGIPNTGMCGIHCVESLGETKEINGIKVHPHFTAFGNVLIPMPAIKKIGYFNTDYDPYGMQDGDYAFRLNRTGHINYYLHGLKAVHVGADAHLNEKSDYRKMKDDGLNTCGDKWGKWTKQYDDTEDYTIDFKEWP
jgi:glycosyltransferase involved in cell wall biosynthesis